MRIYGIDFTSAPGPKKGITYAQCKLIGNGLWLECLGELRSFAEFEHFLRRPGPWVAGMDFPFGQPRKLIENVCWPETWEGYVQHVSGMTKAQFIYVLETYSRDREKGDKHHLRLTDKFARSRSPMMLYRVPVGKMFFEGAPRLLQAGVSVLPCHLLDDSRVVVEAYPALVARRWIGNQSYKADAPQQQTTAHRSVRQEILRGLRSSETKTQFGFNAHVDDQITDVLLQDGSGDRLDAFLCALQTGWSYTQREQNFGIPVDCDPLEGWIVDPILVNGKIILGAQGLR